MENVSTEWWFFLGEKKCRYKLGKVRSRFGPRSCSVVISWRNKSSKSGWFFVGFFLGGNFSSY